MSVSFNQISADLMTPGAYLEVDNSRANVGTPARPNKLLLVGQRLAAGTVLANVPTPITQKDQAGVFFGQRSILASMCRAVKAVNPKVQLYAIALEDTGGGTQASCTLTVTGTATGNGTIFLYLGGRRVLVGISTGMAQNAIATAIAAALTAVTDLPGTAAAATNVVTFTASHKGTVMNGFDVSMNFNLGEALPAGVAIVITAMAGGATDPTVATAIAAIGDVPFARFASGLADSTNVGLLETELVRRWDASLQIDGHLFAGILGSAGAMQAIGNARNSPFSTLMGGGQSITPPWLWAAVTAAVDALESDPARPRTTMPMTGLVAPYETERLMQTERNLLLGDGVSTYTVGADGTPQIERLITTYQVNGASLPDASFRDLTTMHTLSYIRYSVAVRITSKYPRHKLAKDGTLFGPGQAIVTPNVIRAELLGLFREWEFDGLVEDWDQFKDELIVEIDGNNPNRVNVVMGPNLINQFLIFAARIQFIN